MGGQLIDGQWMTQEMTDTNVDGQFVRQPSMFRSWIGTPEFPAEKDRYHLYISFACPWANRAHLFLKLKNLENVISLSVVDDLLLKDGWTFKNHPDPLYQCQFLREIYLMANPHCTSKVTVPVLWDKKQKTIVNNESSEIIQMLNEAFQSFGNALDFFPPKLQSALDEINEFVYHRVNNGVYRAGFATTQEAYEEAVSGLFEALDILDEKLSKQRFLLGECLTAADWRLFTTLIRFDVVYVGHFKCNLRRIIDYPNLGGYIRELYQFPGVSDTIHFDHIKRHYYQSHLDLNPSGIIPMGPYLDFKAPHGRDHLPIAPVATLSDR